MIEEPEDGLVVLMLYELHSHVPEDQRPMSMSDLSDDQAKRARNAIHAIRSKIINSPETLDFMAGVPIEAAHQRERWGSSHDEGKTPFDWFWLIGYLAQKAATAAVTGDVEKALHHTISTAGALANWHASLSGANTQMRPGLGGHV